MSSMHMHKHTYLRVCSYTFACFFRIIVNKMNAGYINKWKKLSFYSYKLVKQIETNRQVNVHAY